MLHVLIVFLILFQSCTSDSYHWQKLETEEYRGKQDDICFVDERTGWYVNGHGKIFHTKDGGNSWQLQLEKEGTFFRCIAFIDEQVGFAGTVGTDYFPNVKDTIPLYGTRDGGLSWAPVEYEGPYVKGLCALDIVKEQFIDHGEIAFRHHIYAVGRVGTPANMMESHDDGLTWRSKAMNSNCAMLFDIDMLSQDIGFVCASTDSDLTETHALILKTNDGGDSWRKVYESQRPFETTWKASFPSKEVGYATIQSYNPDSLICQQRIAKSINGGETWTEMNLVDEFGAREFGIGFIDEHHGYVGTVNSGYETKNGGQTWTAIDLGKACNNIRLYHNDSGVPDGYAIGVDVFKLYPVTSNN